ncbi:MAG: beta-lactamase family protein [Acidobacteria bacterium]|jgi:CubicO group peptidase (beta-lactamase class C family)|nr:beta-lactamase family protein [Bryobacteraceae bacterium CoA2 C42]
MRALSTILRHFLILVMAGLPLAAERATWQAELAFARLLGKYDIPGGALAVARNGEILTSRGFGNVEPESELPIASCTKVITRAAAMLLVKDGRLRLDQPAWGTVAELLPPHRDPRLDRVTIRQLLDHSGGWDRALSKVDVVAANLKAAEPLRAVAAAPLDFDPGRRRRYSNAGALLLGAIVERASGQPFERFVKTRILDPLEMKQTRWSRTPGVREWGAAAGWTASMADLARLANGIDHLVGEPRGAWAQSGALHDWGLAWIYRSADGLSVAWAVNRSPERGDFRAEAQEAVLSALGITERPRPEEAGEGEGAGVRRKLPKPPRNQLRPPVYDSRKHRPMVYRKPKIRR